MPIEPQSKAGAEASVGIPVAKDSDRSKDDQIRERAHLIWVDEGRPDGRELDHWLRAKWELECKPNP
jgi:Protein of unknown function (DUF2934)